MGKDPAVQAPILTFDVAALRSIFREVVDEALDARGIGPLPQLTFLTMAEAVATSGVSRGTLNRAINAGELVAQKKGKGWRIAADELARWMRRDAVPQERPAKVRQT